MSSVFARLATLKHMFGYADEVALDHARRWRAAFDGDPELAKDIIRLGHILTMLPERLVEGVAQPDPIDPMRLAYDQGQRDFALKILAMGGVSISDLNQLMENEDEY